MTSDTLFRANSVSKNPVALALHGTNDEGVSVDIARASRERLRDFGVRLMYRELEMGHEVSREALELIVRWLNDRIG